jgi:uncharacterized SAM-binding protein YcdF (DUF218 family)
MARVIARPIQRRRRLVTVAAPAAFALPVWPFALASIAALLLFVVPARNALIPVMLRPVAWALVVSGPAPQPRVDAVAVSGGGDARGTREAPAALMLKSGRAGVIVAMGGPLPPGDPDGTYAGAVARRLRAHGVPAGAIVRTDEGRSTRHELVALRDLAEARGWRSVAIATSDWHSRRVAAEAERVFLGSPVRWGIVVAPSVDIDLDRWWTSEDGRKRVIDEWLKFAAATTGLA